MPQRGSVPWNKGKSKYPQLNDRDWLHQKYWGEKRSLNQIAKLVGGGCSRDTVRYAMKHFGISRRNLSEAQEGIYLYPLLCDKQWLNEQYIVKKQSSCKIAEIVGRCSPGTVLLALKRFGLQGRNLSDARKLQRFPTHHTKIECIYWAISKRNSINSEYTGDSKIWIGNLNPDFIIRAKRVAIFINGDYWHSPLLNHNVRDTQRADMQAKICRKHKWKPIIIWESDLKRKDAEAFVLNILKKEGAI